MRCGYETLKPAVWRELGQGPHKKEIVRHCRAPQLAPWKFGTGMGSSVEAAPSGILAAICLPTTRELHVNRRLTIRTGIGKHWFTVGLFLVFSLTLADGTASIAGAGRWLKESGGPDAIIFLVFLSSGLMLQSHHIKSGIKDIQGTLLALGLISFVSPAIAVIPGMAPLDRGVKIGLFLVAAMPTTLSTGVVMTGAAGGNIAHALGITILSNGVAVFTVPFTLSCLLQLIDSTVPVLVGESAIMLRIGLLVIAPLAAGAALKAVSGMDSTWYTPKLQIVNQFLVLAIVWVSLSQSRSEILASAPMLPWIAALAFCYHGLVLAVAGACICMLGIPAGRRESVVFMGGQKTLVLSVILHMSLFPGYGLALVFCLIHHIVHLLMDSYLVERIRA